MINIPFSSEFYTVFPAPNSDELISKIDDVCNTQQVDNDFFEWGRYCKVDRIPLIWQDFLDLFEFARFAFTNPLAQKSSSATF